MSIHDFGNKIKAYGAKASARAGESRHLLVLGAVFVGASALSFWLGYTARAKVAQASPVVIQCPQTAYVPTPDTLAPASSTAAGKTSTKTASNSGVSSNTAASGSFVASKSGKKYYPVTCASASRIKDANKVYFQTAAAAMAAGYGAAANCN